MSQYEFQFIANLLIFFFKKKWSNIPLSCLFFTFVQNFRPKKKKKKKKLLIACVFECFQSHFERVTWIFAHEGCHNHFVQSSLIFSFVGLVTWGWVHIWGGNPKKKKRNCQKMNVNLFTTKLGWIVSPSFKGAKSLEITILYNDSQHNTLWANKSLNLGCRYFTLSYTTSLPMLIKTSTNFLWIARNLQSTIFL
jgi:hypothetical protein